MTRIVALTRKEWGRVDTSSQTESVRRGLDTSDCIDMTRIVEYDKSGVDLTSRDGIESVGMR